MTNMTLRAEKTTRNKDDLRVMIAGTLFCIFMILLQPLVFRTYDYFFAKRPFISATVELVYVSDLEFPMVLYDADATQAVNGTWIASIYTFNNNGDEIRQTSRRGFGNYTSKLDDPKLWSWSAFFDNETDSDIPDVPEEAFIVCVRYSVETNDSGVGDESPKYCSSLYDPNHPTLEIEDIIEEENL